MKGNDCMTISSAITKEEKGTEIPERMSREEAERMVELANKILVLIEETSYSYRDVMRALAAIQNNYERKGRDLLNSISIQKVAEFGGLLE